MQNSNTSDLNSVRSLFKFCISLNFLAPTFHKMLLITYLNCHSTANENYFLLVHKACASSILLARLRFLDWEVWTIDSFVQCEYIAILFTIQVYAMMQKSLLFSQRKLYCKYTTFFMKCWTNQFKMYFYEDYIIVYIIMWMSQ